MVRNSCYQYNEIFDENVAEVHEENVGNISEKIINLPARFKKMAVSVEAIAKPNRLLPKGIEFLLRCVHKGNPIRFTTASAMRSPSSGPSMG